MAGSISIESRVPLISWSRDANKRAPTMLNRGLTDEFHPWKGVAIGPDAEHPLTFSQFFGVVSILYSLTRFGGWVFGARVGY